MSNPDGSFSRPLQVNVSGVADNWWLLLFIAMMLALINSSLMELARVAACNGDAACISGLVESASVAEGGEK